MVNIEEWKDIKGYEGMYQVSNLGRIKSLDRKDSRGNFVKGKILKTSLNGKGYRCLKLSKNGIRKPFRVHRLVAETFIPNPDNLPCIDHINTIKTDNRVENLRWCTLKENMNNPITKETCSKSRMGYKPTKETIKKISGKNNHNSQKVYCKELNKTYECIRDAERELGIANQSISACCKGKLKIAGKINGIKLHWKYVD